MDFLKPKDYDVNPSALPSRMTRNNLFWIFSLFAILSVLLFKFPIQETLEGEVEIYHSGAPLFVKAEMSTDLNLFIKDQDEVEKGALLGYYNWDISAEEEELLNTLSSFDFNKTSDSFYKLSSILSEFQGTRIPYLQGEISSIKAAFNLFKSSTEKSSFKNYENAEKARIRSLVKNQELGRTLLASQAKQLELLKEHMEADQKLLERGIISQREYELNKRKYEQEVFNIEEGEISISSMNENIKGIESSIELGKYNLALSELDNFKGLIQSLDAFKKVYFTLKEEKEIIAPKSGKVHFADLMKFTNIPEKGDDILTIVPTKQEVDVLSRVILGAESIGRINEGNRVMISLDAYPMERFGVLFGEIQKKADINQGNRYIYPIRLKDGFMTSYNHKIDPLAELTGKGIILIEKTNIFNIIKNEIMATKSRLSLDDEKKAQKTLSRRMAEK